MPESVRKSYQYKLKPTPEQERALELVVWRCRTRYNTALEQRITAWERCHVSVSRSQQEAELQELRAELPEYAAIHRHVLQDVLARLENGSLVLSKIGRLAVRWSRAVEGRIKTVTLSNEADGWYVCFSCAEVPTQPLPPTERETGIDVGLKVFLITADGQLVENPRH